MALRREVVPGGIMLHSVSVGETLAAIPWCGRSPSLPRFADNCDHNDPRQVQNASSPLFGKDVHHVYSALTICPVP